VRARAVNNRKLRTYSVAKQRLVKTTDWEDSVRAVVNCRVHELAIALQLLVLTTCKWSKNTITNANPIYNYTHSYMWQLVSEVMGMVWNKDHTGLFCYIVTLWKWNNEGSDDGTPAGRNEWSKNGRQNKTQLRRNKGLAKEDDSV
jgi:hypothetical protein